MTLDRQKKRESRSNPQNRDWQYTMKGMAIVIMGVTGSGKSTIGSCLAKAIHCMFIDADDFHCFENKEKMRSGIPLTDEDRLPWLEAVRDTMIDYIIEGKIAVVACSALQPKYREILRTADPEYEPASSDGFSCDKIYGNSFSTSIEVENCAKAPFSRRVVFLWLQAPAELIASRLESRAKEGAHFMSPGLLQSQMDLLQIDDAEGVFCIDATLDPDLIVENIQQKLSDCQLLP